jgi:pimeloyl-ACP methyl ester carboxylesterase
LSQGRELHSGHHSWRFDRDQILALLKESRAESLWSAWAEFPGPLSMVLGGAGSFVTPERLNRARQLRQNRRLSVVQIDQSGHWVHSEQAQKFCEVVSTQLKQWLGEGS